MKSATLRVDPEKLRRMRELAGHTQGSIAKKLRIDRSSVAKWESGQRQPSAAMFKALCKALKSAPDSLLVVPDDKAA